MAFETGMHMRGEQRMLLQPRMLQSIEVLQLPTLELESWLQTTVEANEALSLERPEGAEMGPEPQGRRGTWADAEAHDEMLRNQPDRGRSLAELVEEELAAGDLEPELEEWVRFLIGTLSEEGYLSASDDELLALASESGLGGDRGMLGRAIAALQDLEPRGLGARNAIEALLLQLDPRKPDYAPLCRLLEEFVEELARNKIPAVARAMDLEVDEVVRLVGVLSEFNARPAAALVSRSAPVIVPDVMVEWTGNDFEVRVSRSALPSVSVDEEVQRIVRDRSQSKGVRDYLRGKLEQARWIVEAVQQRGQTLQRVAQTLFAHQRAFLEEGPGHLLPLRMGDVADRLGIHTSTVSRAVSGKYAQTPWGIFPLRGFFQASGGVDEDSARDQVGEAVRAIVAGENRKKPLSDDEIVQELKRRGVRVARRTVAKHRKELGIASSYRRRRYA